MRKWLIASLFSIFTTLLFGQSTITGKVKDQKSGASIPGVSVKIKSSKKGTVTNNEGVFSLQANPGDELEFSAIGFKSKSVRLTGTSDFSIEMEENSAELNEVVVTGNRGMPRVKTESPV